MILASTHRVTYLWEYPPVKTKVSLPSGIPHARYPLLFNSKLPPPVKMCKWSKIFPFMLLKPGTVSAVSLVALLLPPSSTMELGREVGVQAV